MTWRWWSKLCKTNFLFAPLSCCVPPVISNYEDTKQIGGFKFNIWFCTYFKKLDVFFFNLIKVEILKILIAYFALLIWISECVCVISCFCQSCYNLFSCLQFRLIKNLKIEIFFYQRRISYLLQRWFKIFP